MGGAGSRRSLAKVEDDAEQGDGCAALGREDRQRTADSGWQGLDRQAMAVWVEQMVALHEAGVELVLVSSGLWRPV